MTLHARVIRQEKDIKTAEYQVAMWKQQIEDMVIRSPFDGVVTTKNAQPGEMISPNSAGGGFTRTGIGTVVDMNSLEIELDVNESYINRVEPLQPAEAALDAYPDWKIPCKVIAMIPTADRQRRPSRCASASTSSIRASSRTWPSTWPFAKPPALPAAVTRSVPRSKKRLAQSGRSRCRLHRRKWPRPTPPRHRQRHPGRGRPPERGRPAPVKK